TDSQTLQSILSEVRQLRHDLRSTSTMAQRAQIALYRLQRQDEAVNRAAQRLREAQNKVANLVNDRSQLLRHIADLERIAKDSPNFEDRNRLEEGPIPNLKSQLAALSKQEEQAKTEQMEAEQQLQDERIKLAGLNDTLDRLNNALEAMGQK